MRKFLTVGGVALLATALLLNGAPASAGSVSWDDPDGDAISFLGESPPRPSEPVYDILKVSMSSDGEHLLVNAGIKDLGTIPPQATGNVYRFAFTAGEGRFTLSIIQDHVAGEFHTFSVLDATTGVNTATDCFRCMGKMNLESKTVEISLPIGSLDSARRAAQVPGKIGPGTKIEEVTMLAGEYYNLGYRIPGVYEVAGGLVSISNDADQAPLPAPGAFTL